MKAILQDLAELKTMYPSSAVSYADALTAAIRRLGNIEIGADPFNPKEGPKLVFKEVPEGYMVDHFFTGGHAMLYELEGSGKRYRVTIEPIKETHGG